MAGPPPEAPTSAVATEVGRCCYCGDSKGSKWCSWCREVSYCCVGCQRAHWAEHRRSCSRNYAPPVREQAPAAPPEHPCVSCGKAGLKESCGQWFCSHECLGGNLSDLTAQVRQLAGGGGCPPKAPDAESQRIMDLIRGTQQGAGSQQPKPSTEPMLESQRILKLIKGAQQPKPSDQKPKPPTEQEQESQRILNLIHGMQQQPKPSGDQQDSQRIRDLIKGAQQPKHSPEQEQEAQRLRDLIQGASQRPKVLPVREPEHESLRLKSFIQGAVGKPAAIDADAVRANVADIMSLIAKAERGELAPADPIPPEDSARIGR